MLKAGAYLVRTNNLPRWGDYHFFYSIYYGAQAGFQLGDNYWAAYRPALHQVGAQLTSRAREWYLAEVIRIALADGPLSETERQAALAIGVDLGMTQAQVVGVVAMTEQSAGRD